MSDYYAQLQQARAHGRECADNEIAAGETTPDESPLSGEWSGSLLPTDVVEMATGLSHDDIAEILNEPGNDFILTDFCDAWEDGYHSAAWPNYREAE